MWPATRGVDHSTPKSELHTATDAKPNLDDFCDDFCAGASGNTSAYLRGQFGHGGEQVAAHRVRQGVLLRQAAQRAQHSARAHVRQRAILAQHPQYDLSVR